MHNIFFNAHHSPIGAFASFTLGFPGASGGLGLEIGQPANQQVYIGAQSRDGRYYEALPFFNTHIDGVRANYEATEGETVANPDNLLRPFPHDQIQRDYQLSTDTWQAGDLTFRIISPLLAVPDPDSATAAELGRALLPVVFAELTLDNRSGTQPRRAFFGWQGHDHGPAMRRLQDSQPDLVGIAQGRETAVVACDEGTKAANGFVVEDILGAAKLSLWEFGLGPCSLLLFNVPPGEQRTVRFAICFHRAGIVTANLDATYTYTRVFPTIEAVATYAREHSANLIAEWKTANQLVENSHLSANQRFMLIHAIRSYYGSTQLLDVGQRPFWIVNEGEYRMINTFDLAADQLFYECRFNPWTVRNVLDWYVERYSYHDQIHAPGETITYPGGLGFTHDMGVANVFSRPGYSAYELSGLNGLFSYMTHEELVNWVCCAGVYLAQTGDSAWRHRQLDTFIACLRSLTHRDHPDPTQRDGVMDMDSDRTQFGGEITTYDSLDVSLGQARRNLYLAGKSWAAYVLLEKVLGDAGQTELAQQAGQQAEKCARTITEKLTTDGFIPAILDGAGNGAHSDSDMPGVPRIIPAIEGLIFPYMAGCAEALAENGRFAAYLSALKTHLQTILIPGVCLFADGGWKLSSTSDNSWLSKIYLCQFVARQILGLAEDANGRAADAAHVQWLTHPQLSYWAWSDQIVAGKITGSKYYPRGVTAVLWLDEKL